MAKAANKDAFDWSSFLDSSPDDMSGWMTDPNQFASPPNSGPPDFNYGQGPGVNDGGGAGSIAGGDSAGGGAGMDVGGTSGLPSFDQNAFNQALQSALGGGGGGSSTLQQVIRALTGSGAGGTGLGALGALLPFLASIYGGIQSRNATQDATHQIQDSLANANTQISSMLGGAQANYKPYMDAGTAGLAKLQSMGGSNLAGQFGPLGSGKGWSLGRTARGG